jgi:hypothetical protein
MVNPARMQRFLELYEENLRAAILKYPDEYRYPVERVPKVVAAMGKAMETRSYNKDGFGFRWTCRELGLPYTYTAINAYLAGA